MVEIVISVAALLFILALGRIGMQFGAFYELVSSLLLFLAMMFTLRYWYLLTRWVSGWFAGGAGYAAFGAYWVLFLVGCVPLLVVMSRVSNDSVPRYPRAIDAVLGLVFGSVSAAILMCCVMTSLSVIGPKVYEPYNRDALVVPLDTISLSIYRAIESGGLHISTNDPGHTRFPTFEKTDVDDLQKYWQ